MVAAEFQSIGGRWDPQRHHRLSPRIEVGGDPLERSAGRVVVGDQVERGPGQIDRTIGPRQGQVLHALAVGDDLEARDVGSGVAAVEHVLRRIDPVDVDAASDKFEKGPVIPAAEFQGRLPGVTDELQIAAGIEGVTPQRGVHISDDPGVEICSAHANIRSLSRLSQMRNVLR